MNQIHVVDHPIRIGATVNGLRPSCPCRGARMEPFKGIVAKVIRNQAGYWYFLTDLGITVKGEWVTLVS